MPQTLRYIPWVVMAFLASFLAFKTAKYLSFESDIFFLLRKQDVIFDPVWRPTFYAHVISGILVILIGPLQFLKTFRNKNMKLHRLFGKVYAYGILLVAAPTGFIMAFYAEGGYWSTVSFIIMSTLWFYTTFMAVRAVMRKDILGHQQWMYRSYALSFAAVTLRILVPLMSIPEVSKHLGSTTDERDYAIIVATAWLSWIINLIFVEILIARKFEKKTQKT